MYANQVIASPTVQTELWRSHLKGSYSSPTTRAPSQDVSCAYPSHTNVVQHLLKLWPCGSTLEQFTIKLQLQDYCGWLSSSETCSFKPFYLQSETSPISFADFHLRNTGFTSSLGTNSSTVNCQAPKAQKEIIFCVRMSPLERWLW